MRKTLYIHIGAHKTATTTIQRAFWENRAMLAGQGVLYPETNHYHYAQHRLGFALGGRRDPARGDVPDLATEMRDLGAAMAASRCRRVFVSSETMFSVPEKRIEAMKQELGNARVVILAFVRRQDDYLLSLYNQNVKQSGNGFSKPLRHFVNDPRSINREISYLPALRRWRKAFGRASVRLFRYEDADPLDTVLDVLSVPPGLIERPEPANPSVHWGVIELVRWVKLLGLPPAWQEFAREQSAARLFLGRGRPPLSQAQRRRILAQFDTENDRMFRSFGMENTYRSEISGQPYSAASDGSASFSR